MEEPNGPISSKSIMNHSFMDIQMDEQDQKQQKSNSRMDSHLKHGKTITCQDTSTGKEFVRQHLSRMHLHGEFTLYVLGRSFGEHYIVKRFKTTLILFYQEQKNFGRKMSTSNNFELKGHTFENVFLVLKLHCQKVGGVKQY